VRPLEVRDTPACVCDGVGARETGSKGMLVLADRPVSAAGSRSPGMRAAVQSWATVCQPCVTGLRQHLWLVAAFNTLLHRHFASLSKACSC